MWIMMNNSFLSIVSPTPDSPTLDVRARARGDIQRVFPGAKVVSIAGRDYAFRAHLPREVVAAAIADRLLNTDYANFKDSVAENDRHDAYFSVWGVMAQFQEDRGHGYPYHTTKTGKAPRRASRRPTPRQRRLPLAGDFDGGMPDYEPRPLTITGDAILDAGGDYYDFMAAEEG